MIKTYLESGWLVYSRGITCIDRQTRLKNDGLTYVGGIKLTPDTINCSVK